MERKAARNRLLNILEIAPALKAIFLSSDSIEIKREKIRAFLANMLWATFDDDPTIPPLEWVLTRDAIGVFKSVLSKRNEQLSKFSFINYINDLLHNDSIRDLPKPSPDFLAELEHLLRGVVGKTGVYTEKIPTFAKYKGRRAANLRSADLSRIARTADKYIARYLSGLDEEVIGRRQANKSRILDYFGASAEDWENWKWHTGHIIRSADTLNKLTELTDEEYRAVKLARENKVPFGITPYYLSLMDPEPNEKDRAVRRQVIPTLGYVEKMMASRDCEECSMDFMLERDTSPIEGITRRYPKIAILKPILTCPQICVYCQRNWEIEDVYSLSAIQSKKSLERAIEWIANTPELNEILVTGGDPLLLSDERIEALVASLSRIKHLERIRIGTRTPVTLPQRITEDLVQSISRFHEPGKRELVIVTHFESAYEITPQSMDAVQKFRRQGMEVYNQLVYTFYNSRKFEAVSLRNKLRSIGVTPYYTFNTKGKEETDDYRVPIARLLQEQKEEARLYPGTVRTDEIVFNVPGLGKNYLRASQHHDMISILPDGRRVYEFHPWEKQLFLVNTYVYTDVSIYDYLRRLKAAGETISNYRTIWYYY